MGEASEAKKGVLSMWMYDRAAQLYNEQIVAKYAHSTAAPPDGLAYAKTSGDKIKAVCERCTSTARAASREQVRRGVVLAPADPDGEHARAVVALMELAETTEAAAAAEAAEAAAAAAAAEAASPEAEAGQEPAAADVKPTSQSRRDFDYNFAVSQRAIRSSTCQTRRPVLDSPLTPATEYGRYTREQIEDREVTITTRVQRRLAKAVGAKQALSKSFTAEMQRTAILDKMELELEPEPVQSNANALATIGSGE